MPESARAAPDPAEASGEQMSSRRNLPAPLQAPSFIPKSGQVFWSEAEAASSAGPAVSDRVAPLPHMLPNPTDLGGKNSRTNQKSQTKPSRFGEQLCAYVVSSTRSEVFGITKLLIADWCFLLCSQHMFRSWIKFWCFVKKTFNFHLFR